MVDLSKETSKASAKHCAALFFNDILEVFLKGSADTIDGQGTMTFINYHDRCFGVTNQHVLTDYVRPTKEKAFHIALRNHIPIPGRLLFKSTKDNPDFPFDIAVFLLEENKIIKGGKIPINLEAEYAPMAEQEQGLAIGFPAIERHVKDGLTMAHPLYHVVAKCISASDRQIILHEELLPPQDRVIRFGGMSGGPIFRFNESESYSFTGIMFEGRGFADNENGLSENEIWIYGFPLSNDMFDHALEVFKPSLDEL